jgi:hypothetical protein
MQENSSFAYIILGSVLRIFRHDIAEILLKVELNTKIQIHSTEDIGDEREEDKEEDN